MKRVLCLLGLVATLAMADDGDSSVVFVPKQGTIDKALIEIVIPLKAKREAYSKSQELRRLVEQRFRTERPGDQYNYLAKCIVEPKQFEVGEVSLRIECWSLALWSGDDPFAAIGAASSASEALLFINQFLTKHRERLLRPRPGASLTLAT